MLFVTQASIIVLSSNLAGCFYCLGGRAKQNKWYDFMLNTKTRDFGVPALMVLSLLVLGKFHWSLILCFGAMFGTMTTYNKWVSYLFNRPDKHTVYPESWFVTGLFYGLSMLPYVIFHSHNYLSFSMMCLITALATCLWSISIGKAWLEEFGRGVIILLSITFTFR